LSGAADAPRVPCYVSTSTEGETGGEREGRARGKSEREEQVLSCLEVVHALGYVNALDDALVAKLNRVIGTLVRLVGH
jgi:hypothetical protein